MNRKDILKISFVFMIILLIFILITVKTTPTYHDILKETDTEYFEENKDHINPNILDDKKQIELIRGED